MKIVFVYWGYENAEHARPARLCARRRGARSRDHGLLPAEPRLHARLFERAGKARTRSSSYSNGPPICNSATGSDWARLLEVVPRSRRIVMDCDGAYKRGLMEFRGDYNHKTPEKSRRWIEVCDSISDKILQPTLRPKWPNVKPFLFHIYDPTWELPLDFSHKEFSIIYVGHTKFRWHGMSQVLQAIEPAGASRRAASGWWARAGTPRWNGPNIRRSKPTISSIAPGCGRTASRRCLPCRFRK